MNIQSSKDVMKYILPIVAGISAGGCASGEMELQTPQEALASEREANIGVIRIPVAGAAQKNICEQGNDVWNKLQGALSCVTTNNEAVHAELQNSTEALVDQMEKIIMSKASKEVGLSVISSELIGTAFEINNLTDGHHRCEIYWDPYQVIVNIYKNVQYDEKKGYTGTDFYNLSLGMNSLSMRHMVNGMACSNCSTMDFAFNPGELCGSYEMGEAYGENDENGGVAFGTIYAGKNNTDGENGLKCEKTSSKNPQPYMTEDVTTKCDDGAKAAASCREGPDGSRYEGVIKTGKKIGDLYLADQKTFKRIQAMMGEKGFVVPNFEK